MRGAGTGAGRGPAETRPPTSGWAIAAAFAVVAVLLYEVRYALLPFVFAIAIAFVFDPVVARLHIGGRRWPGAILVWLLVLAALGAGGYFIGSTAVGELLQFLRNLPKIAHDMVVNLAGPQGISLFGKTYSADALVQQGGSLLSHAVAAGTVLEFAGLGGAAIFGAFLLLVLIPYFLISGPRLARGTIWLIPPERRHFVEQLMPQLVPVLRRYLIGISLVVAYTATVAWIGFGPVFHLPHALLLGITVGVLEIIPAVGPMSSIILVSLAAFEQTSLWATGTLIAFVIFLRLTIDNLVGPLVLGQAARLHPVVIIFAFVCGAMLFGVIGLLLAVPAAVCIKVTLQHYYAEPIRPAGKG